LFRDIFVLRGQFRGMFGDEGQDGPQILHVEQQQPCWSATRKAIFSPLS
jgi:hypothetical protein